MKERFYDGFEQLLPKPPTVMDNLPEVPDTPPKTVRTLDARKIMRRVLRGCLFVVCVVVGVAVFGLVFYRAYAFIDDTIVKFRYSRPGVTQPEPDFLLIDGITPAHRMTFTAPDGATLYIPEMHATYPFLDGKLTLTLPDNRWYTQQDFDARIQEIAVTLTPVLTTQRGQKVPLPNITYNALLAAAPVTLIRPAFGHDSVSYAVYMLRFKVLPEASVMVNGNDVSDLINQDGIVTVNLPIEPKGENPISILVDAPGYRQNRLDISIFRAQMATPIELDANTSAESGKSTMTIRGTTLPGADFDVLSPFDESTLKYDSATGIFSFDAKFTKIGENSVTLIAQMPGRPDSFVDFKVTYVPNIDDYSKRAWKMDYKDLVGNLISRIGTVYAFDAAVAKRIEGQVYMVDIGGGEYLYVENAVVNSAYLDVGVTYRFWADVTSADDIYPYLAARYIFISRTYIQTEG